MTGSWKLSHGTLRYRKSCATVKQWFICHCIPEGGSGILFFKANTQRVSFEL